VKLYRPVGVSELELIAKSGWKSYPPRLSHQPIFYPVLSFPYAEAIAKNWNTKDPNSGFAGFVTSFEVMDDYVKRFPIRIVGGRDDQELWVPADELPEFNHNILGLICCEASYYGSEYVEPIDRMTGLPVSISKKP
jgi:hypothetical protein